jgi:hydrogenase expression/formation protein HypE
MRSDRILLAHGSGGTMMRELIEEIIVPDFDDDELKRLDDAASLAFPAGRLAFSTDTYVVNPIFFPGGDIGRLAVCGTVNDVATSGATPLYISVGFVLEEGFPVEDLRRVLISMRDACREAGVHIVTGDTKVVEKGHGDGIFINTAGVGSLPDGVDLSGSYCKPGDKVLVSGTLGDHGIAIISTREGLEFETSIETDAAPLNKLIANVLAAAPGTRGFRDPTRGGISSTLNEFATASGVSITIEETAVPVKDQVRGASEMLGYDVFQVANEGKMVAVVPAEQAEAALAAMKASPYGEDAAIIGECAEGPAGKVYVHTAFGATRIMDMLVGEQLPRIC